MDKMPQLIVTRDPAFSTWFCYRNDAPSRTYGRQTPTSAFRTACRAFGFIEDDYRVAERMEHRVVYEWHRSDGFVPDDPPALNPDAASDSNRPPTQ